MLRKSTARVTFEADKSNSTKTANEQGPSPSTGYRTFITAHFQIMLPIFQGITSKPGFPSYLLGFTLFTMIKECLKKTQMSQNVL